MAGLLVAVPAVGHTDPRARAHYIQHCAGCHQLDGSGSARARVPDLRGTVGHFLRTPAGRAFLVKVPGSLQAPLRDAELAEVLNWILREFSSESMRGQFIPFTANEVHEARAAPLDDVKAERMRIAREIRSLGY